ncbi:MAG TPA: Clp protease N-terminal domain-containing protein, partial [Longimicrobiaceae bacterium]
MFKVWFSNEPEQPSGRGPLDFGDDARDALARARDAAIALNHKYVDTGHMLRGIVEDPRCEGARALAALGVDVDELRRLAKVAAPAGARVVALGSELPYLNDAKRALEGAMEERMRAGGGVITSRHLLLGIARQPRDVGGRVLAELGVTVDRLRGVESTGAAGLVRIDDESELSI